MRCGWSHPVRDSRSNIIGTREKEIISLVSCFSAFFPFSLASSFTIFFTDKRYLMPLRWLHWSSTLHYYHILILRYREFYVVFSVKAELWITVIISHSGFILPLIIPLCIYDFHVLPYTKHNDPVEIFCFQHEYWNSYEVKKKAYSHALCDSGLDKKFMVR